MARMKRSILSFCAAKTRSTLERTCDMSALAPRVLSGVGQTVVEELRADFSAGLFPPP
jgi:hypothetical protein